MPTKIDHEPGGTPFLDTYESAEQLEQLNEQLGREKQRADQQKRLAHKASKRADEEKRKREELIAKLKEHGFDPDNL